jgi:hypothetical protein
MSQTVKEHARASTSNRTVKHSSFVPSTPDCCRVFIDYACRLEGLTAFDVDVLGEVYTVRGSFTTHVSYRIRPKNGY